MSSRVRRQNENAVLASSSISDPKCIMAIGEVRQTLDEISIFSESNRTLCRCEHMIVIDCMRAYSQTVNWRNAILARGTPGTAGDFHFSMESVNTTVTTTTIDKQSESSWGAQTKKRKEFSLWFEIFEQIVCLRSIINLRNWCWNRRLIESFDHRTDNGIQIDCFEFNLWATSGNYESVVRLSLINFHFNRIENFVWQSEWPTISLDNSE